MIRRPRDCHSSPPKTVPRSPSLLPAGKDRRPWGCHTPRISEAMVFGRPVQVLARGCGDERAADGDCSATTLRRRDEWFASGVMQTLRMLVLATYDRMIGRELDQLPTTLDRL